MSRVLTNNITVAWALEDTTATGFGILPASPTWKQIEPNDISKWGAEIKTVARLPISKNRQVRKGTITDLDSKVDLKVDLTMDCLKDFIDGFMFARAYSSGAEYWAPTGVSSGAGYALGVTSGPVRVFSAGSGGTVTGAATLVYARGFTVTGNNGLKLVTAVVTGATPTIFCSGAGLADEVVSVSTGQYAQLEVAGVRTLIGDLDVNASGNITSTVVDFTTLGLHVGQYVYVGDSGAHAFSGSSANGFMRIQAIAANLLSFDHRAQASTGAQANTATSIDIYFGRFIRNVTVDDVDYVSRQYMFEASFPALMTGGVDGFEYAKGNFCDQVEFDLPLANKATATWQFIGTDTDAPVVSGSRKTNAVQARVPVETVAFNSTSSVAALTVTKYDETGLTTDFKDVKIKLDNNVGPEKVIGTLGARFMNSGIFNVDLTTKALFTNADVLAAIRANTTCSMHFALHNDDGGFVMDIPALTLGDGAKDFPLNQTVTIAIKGKAFIDPTLGTSLSWSFFPYLPLS